MNNPKEKYRYYRGYQTLREQSETGSLQPGQKLPTEAQLQEQFSVSRDTVRKALAKLEQEGLLSRKAAVGTAVRRQKSDYKLTAMTSFSEQMRSRGLEPSSELVKIELCSELREEIRLALALEPGEKCYMISRVRKADASPMAYEETYIPYRICPNLQKHIDETASLYEIYEGEYGLAIGNGSVTLEAVLPNTQLQAYLQVGRDSPLLYMQCTGYLKNGQPFYYVDGYYIGEKYVFSTNVVRLG